MNLLFIICYIYLHVVLDAESGIPQKIMFSQTVSKHILWYTVYYFIHSQRGMNFSLQWQWLSNVYLSSWVNVILLNLDFLIMLHDCMSL